MFAETSMRALAPTFHLARTGLAVLSVPLRRGAAWLLALFLAGWRAAPPAARYGGVALIALTIAVSLNALLDQPAHPRPWAWATTRAPVLPPSRDAALVRAIQTGLKDLDLYEGPVDGIPGERTRDAIRDYERRAGLPQTGEPERDLLSGLMQGLEGGHEGETPRATASLAPPEPAPQAEEPAPDPAAPSTILKVQAALAPNYGPLGVDGVLGRRTRDAVRRFQADEGLPETGEIDAETIERLMTTGNWPEG